MSVLTRDDIEKGRALAASLPAGEPTVDGYAIMEFVNEDMSERLAEKGEDRYPNDSDAMESAFLFGWNQCADAFKPVRLAYPAALDHIDTVEAESKRLTDELEATEASHQDESAAHAETLEMVSRAEADKSKLADIIEAERAEVKRLRALVEESFYEGCLEGRSGEWGRSDAKEALR